MAVAVAVAVAGAPVVGPDFRAAHWAMALPLVQVLATVLSHATGWAGAGVCTGCAVYTSNAKMADGMR